MPVRTMKLTCGPAAGSSGSATAAATSDDVINGIILAVHLKYTDSPPVTTNVTLEEAVNSPAMPILKVSDAATDGWFYPMADVVDQEGGAVTGVAQQIPVCDKLKVSIAGANAGDGVVVTVRYAG